MAVQYRMAGEDDCPRLGELNHQLIRDEGHRNAMTASQLQERMRGWLTGEYRAVIFEDQNGLIGYALYREDDDEIYLRQFFIVRNRRRQGLGRQAMDILFGQVWPKTKRLTVEVLCQNQSAIAFWKALGYKEYCLTLEIMPEK